MWSSEDKSQSTSEDGKDCFHEEITMSHIHPWHLDFGHIRLTPQDKFIFNTSFKGNWC